MQQWLNLPEWLPSWAPLVLLLLGLLWGLSFLFMPFSVFGVKSRLEVLEQRLDEIQNEIRHIALRMPTAAAVGTDYDDMYPPRMAEARASERMLTRPPIPPARHEMPKASAPVREPPPREPIRDFQRETPREMPREAMRETPREAPHEPMREPARETMREPIREPAREPPREAMREPPREPILEDRPPPSPSARPARRIEPLNRPASPASPSSARSEPRLDWRR